MQILRGWIEDVEEWSLEKELVIQEEDAETFNTQTVVNLQNYQVFECIEHIQGRDQ